MAKRYMKRCSASLVIRETQIKITVRYCLTPVRVTITEKIRSNKCCQGWGEKGICELLVGNVNCCSNYEKLWKFLKRFKIELPYDTVISLWIFIQRKQKHYSEKMYATM